MDSVVFRLMTPDSRLRVRWRRWLAARGWEVTEIDASSELPSTPRGRAGPWLLDAALLKDSDLPAIRALSSHKTPVIVFGEGPNAENDRIAFWLRQGADDFIEASIQERLLVAKLEAHLRRIPARLELSVAFSPCRRIKADLKRRMAWIRAAGGSWRLIDSLTDTECRILGLFLSEPNRLLPRSAILEELWGEKAHEVYPATLTQHIASLRRKLGALGEEIRTVYGRGYMLKEKS